MSEPSLPPLFDVMAVGAKLTEKGDIEMMVLHGERLTVVFNLSSMQALKLASELEASLHRKIEKIQAERKEQKA